MAEFYATGIAHVKKIIADEVLSAPIPSASMQADVWTAPRSRADYMGVSITFLDRFFETHSYLLAAREFRPTPELKSKGAELAHLYLEDVAAQFDVDLYQHVFSFTTDAGSNMKRMVGELLDRCMYLQKMDDQDPRRAAVDELIDAMGTHLLWEWCKCHMLHLGCVDGAGISIKDSKRTNTNPLADALLAGVLEVVNGLNRKSQAKELFEAAQQTSVLAGTGRTVKLRSVVKQRWAAIAILLSRVLVFFDEIDKAWYAATGQPCPFKENKEELLEIYSIIQPVAALITKCQAPMTKGGFPRAVQSHLGLITLRLGALNSNKPLTLLDPATGAPATETLNERRVVKRRSHAQLSAVAQSVRSLIAEGIDKRGLRAQYSDPSYKQRATDMAMLLYVPSTSLDYMEVMAELYGVDAGVTLELQAGVELSVKRMVELVIKRQRKAKAAAAAAARADEGERSAASSTRLAPLFKKQKQMAPLAQDAVSMGLLSLGGGGAARAGVGEERSPAAEAQVLLDKYKERAAELATPAFVAEYPPEAVGMWWRQQPDDALKAVARAVLGQCPSSAPLENYFSTAADIATRRRASLDPCRVEMLLVCNVLRRHLKRFPLHDIMTIAEDKVADFLPSRFTRDELKKQLELFGQLLEEGTAGQDQEDDGADQVQELAGWSSLADEWDIEGLDLETAQPTVNLPPAPAAAAAAAAAASD